MKLPPLIYLLLLAPSQTTKEPKLQPHSWMSHCSVKSKTLSQITLLGSHDSASITLNGKNLNGKISSLKLTKGVGCGVQLLMNAFSITGWHFHELLKNWAQTQRLTIYNQLRAGVRFLDLRIGISDHDKVWRIHHGMVYGEGLEKTLLMIKQFLEENPGEIVIVGVSHVENFSINHMNELLAKLNVMFEGMLFRYFKEWRQTKIEDLVKAGKRFIFMLTDLELEWLGKDDTVWVNHDNRFLINTWANQDSFDKMIDFNEKQVDIFQRRIQGLKKQHKFVFDDEYGGSSCDARFFGKSK